MNNGKPTFPLGSRIIAYLRDSGGDDQDLSVEQQEAVVRRWCSENGLDLVEIFKDIAVSGSSTVSRDAFQAMMRYFRSPQCPAAGAVIWKFSRFARDIDDAQFYKADLRRRGFIIHSLNDTIPAGSDGRFFEAAIDWMNSRFLEDLSTDVKRGLHHLVRQYGCVPGNPPKGFIREPVEIGRRRDGSIHLVHRWVPDPDLWETCRIAWTMRAGGANLKQIQAATHLFRSLSSYATFFKNRLYLGELVFGGEVIADYCQPLINLATWNAVQAINQKNTAMSASTIRRANSSFVLSGLVFCTCGSPLNGRVVKFKNTNGYQYYACCKDSPDECQAKKIPKDVLESAVIESVVKYILSPECLAALQADQVYEYQHRSAENQARRSELVAQLRSVRAAITNITSAIAGIGYSKALLTKLAEMEKREIEITNQIAELDAWLSTPPEQLTPDNLKQYSGALHSALTSADVKIQREILTAFISKITVERDGKTITGLISYYQPPTDLLRSNSDPDPPNNDIYAYISTPLRGARCRAP